MMNGVWRNYNRRGTQDLILWRRLKTPVWGGIHCMEKSCRLYHQLNSHLRQNHLHLDLSETTQMMMVMAVSLLARIFEECISFSFFF